MKTISFATRRRVLGWTAALAAAGFLSACGFHLRGSMGEANLPFKTIYLGFSDTSPLGVELRRNIRAAGGTTVVTDPKAAQAIMEVLGENKGKAILSLNSQGRVREYTLTYNLRFRVKDAQGRELLAPTEIALRRTLNYDETQVLAKESEETLLYRDMQTDLVRQVLRRLAAIKVAAEDGASQPAPAQQQTPGPQSPAPLSPASQ